MYITKCTYIPNSILYQCIEYKNVVNNIEVKIVNFIRDSFISINYNNLPIYSYIVCYHFTIVACYMNTL